MFAMRYPNLPYEDLEYENLLDQRFHESSGNTIRNRCISPSFPGMAFAACAASLPLLRTRDPVACSKVLTLFQASLHCIFEPDTEHEHESVQIGERLNDIEKCRLKHLLRRIEQVWSVYFCSTTSYLLYLSHLFSPFPCVDPPISSSGPKHR